MLIVFFLIAGVIAQTEPESGIQETMRVEYVVVDVFAEDSNGTPVKDLRAEDFVVRHDRDPIDVAFFNTMDYTFAPPRGELLAQNTALLESEPEAEPEVVFAQTLILVLDFGLVDPPQRRSALGELREFFENLNPRLNLNIYMFGVGVGPITDRFTNDPKTALAALDRHQSQLMKSSQGSLMVSTHARLAQLEEELDKCLAHLETAPSGGGTPDPVQVGIYYRCLVATYDTFVNMQLAHTNGSLVMLDGVVRAMGNLPGMKSLYFISPGFSLHPGDTAASVARSYVDRVKMGMFDATGPLKGGVKPILPSFSRRSLHTEFRLVSGAANENRVVFHAFGWGGVDGLARIDSSHELAGLSSNTQQFYDMMFEEMNDGLISIAKDTGGSFHETSDLAGEIQRTVDQYSFYYLIGFDPPEPKRRRQQAKVDIDCKRDGVRLKYRRTFAQRIDRDE